MFSHIFSKPKHHIRFKDLVPKKKGSGHLSRTTSGNETEGESGGGEKDNQINTADINYKEYDQVHLLCMRVIVYFVSKYVIVYDIKTWDLPDSSRAFTTTTTTKSGPFACPMIKFFVPRAISILATGKCTCGE